MKPSVNRIDPRAARYLELLVEFGHLDAAAAQEVLHAACEAYVGSPHPIGLAAIQRHASVRLIRWDSPKPDSGDILSADWPLLFQ